MKTRRASSSRQRIMLVLLLVASIAACGKNTTSSNDNAVVAAAHPTAAETSPPSQAMDGLDADGIELSTMTQEDYSDVVGDYPDCRFLLTEFALPILAVAGERGVIKIDDELVVLALRGPNTLSAPDFRLVTEDITVDVRPIDEGHASAEGPVDAELDFKVTRGSSLDYRGYLDCSAPEDL